MKTHDAINLKQKHAKHRKFKKQDEKKMPYIREHVKMSEFKLGMKKR